MSATAVESPRRWCARCKSPAAEERVQGAAGRWWRWVCTGCGHVGGQHSEREHRRHLARERRALERSQRRERAVPSSARWYLDQDERSGG